MIYLKYIEHCTKQLQRYMKHSFQAQWKIYKSGGYIES